MTALPPVPCSASSLFRPNLGKNELGRRSARELAEAAGFRIEDHQAVTSDGFILVLHRLVDPDRVVRCTQIHTYHID